MDDLEKKTVHKNSVLTIIYNIKQFFSEHFLLWPVSVEVESRDWRGFVLLRGFKYCESSPDIFVDGTEMFQRGGNSWTVPSIGFNSPFVRVSSWKRPESVGDEVYGFMRPVSIHISFCWKSCPTFRRVQWPSAFYRIDRRPVFVYCDLLVMGGLTRRKAMLRKYGRMGGRPKKIRTEGQSADHQIWYDEYPMTRIFQ
jgi:hypothetical protein